MKTKNAKNAKKILVVDRRKSVVLFSILTLLPCAMEILPDFLWHEAYFSAFDAMGVGLSGLAFTWCRYEDVESKALSFVLLLWRSFVAMINMAGLDPMYSPYFVISCALALAYMCIRVRKLPKIVSTVPDPDEACYALLPIRAPVGLLQAIFLPWHMGRYESRVVFDNGDCWLVYRGRFKRINMKPEQAVKQGWDLYPVGRPLTLEERLRLDDLVGQRSITGFRDCRKLLVAGRIK